MNTDKLLGMLLEAIDYSFLQVDGSYDKALTYPVIDKIQFIKEQVKNMEVKEVDLEKEIDRWQGCEAFPEGVGITPLPKAMEIVERTAKHFFELGIKARKEEVK